MRNRTTPAGSRRPLAGPVAPLRIIGGTLRGRRIHYSGDPRTRPMKDRVREAIFNLLGPVKGMHALDLFAGTGALGFEAISRGAGRATFVERHFPTAGLIRRNAAEFGVAEQCEIVAADTFLWVQKQLRPQKDAWLAFVSPPYAFYHDRRGDMLSLVETLLTRAPTDSVLVVESDEDFDLGLLPQPENWRVRHYRPAAVAILRVGEIEGRTMEAE